MHKVFHEDVIFLDLGIWSQMSQWGHVKMSKEDQTAPKTTQDDKKNISSVAPISRSLHQNADLECLGVVNILNTHEARKRMYGEND